MFKKRAVLAIIVTIIVVGMSSFGMLMYLDRRDYRIFLENQYLRNLYEVVTNVEGLQVSLSKVPVTNSNEERILLFGQIWKQASIAQDKLNSLPISQESISQTSRFLSQVGDFSYALLKTNNKGQSLTQNDIDNVAKLTQNTLALNNELHNVQQTISKGNIDWGEIKSKGRNLFKRTATNTVDVKFQKLAQDMQQYPTLIYDGPFSENVLKIKPRILSEKQISVDDAKKILSDIYGKDKISQIDVANDKKGQTIPAYSFAIKLKGNEKNPINIDLSINGGKIVYLLDSRTIQNAKLDMKSSIQKGEKYLQNIGYTNMIPTYSLKYDNVAIVNYIYVQNKVVIYPDQIKLKIAMDTGDIIGIEAQHYLIAHTNRNIKTPPVSAEEAKKAVNNNLDIKNIRLTLIPTDSNKEVLCYEFYGMYKDEKYIVYINANDGTEEKILKIIKTPNGELTM